ncbi:MAG: hypothetical protein CVU87_04215 [Firmicutes bacterium HGW-Firmicutes-12]|jgi:peptidoglycan hydrolase CwlO-like protein|nr:MAG: hypothetical protein CVU87_04215 [Firmicutes bacterium HGW-Firmicutes-12]
MDRPNERQTDQQRELLLSPNESSRAHTRRKTRNNFLGGVFIFILWCGLVFSGFYVARHYIDQAIQKVQQTNAMNVQAINERLDILTADMKSLENAVGSTGQTISSSGSVQQEILARMAQFEQQIQELKSSLNILKEAP